MSVFKEKCPDLALLVEDVIKNAQVQVPFESLREKLSVLQEGHRQREIEYILVDQSDQVVVPSHQTIRNIVRVHTLLRLAAHEPTMSFFDTSGSGRVRVSKHHQALHDFLPRDGLNIRIGDLEKIEVIILHVPQATEIQAVLKQFPDP